MTGRPSCHTAGGSWTYITDLILRNCSSQVLCAQPGSPEWRGQYMRVLIFLKDGISNKKICMMSITWISCWADCTWDDVPFISTVISSGLPKLSWIVTTAPLLARMYAMFAPLTPMISSAYVSGICMVWVICMSFVLISNSLMWTSIRPCLQLASNYYVISKKG